MTDRPIPNMPDLSRLLHVDHGELADLAKANAEAALAAQQALVDGLAAVNQELFAFAQERVARSLDATRSLAGCATMQEATAVQLDYARDFAQAYLGEMTKLAEMSGKVAGDVLAPMRARAAAAEKTVADVAA